jgi:uncharacterized lipoprotein YmbA
MTTPSRLQNFGLTIFMVLVLLTGCRSFTPAVEFYTLTPLAGLPEADKAAGLPDTIAVGVGPLHMPKIIDRPQIVSRIGSNQIDMDEFHRWAGSVYEDFLRVVALNLSALLNSNLVAVYPWEDYFDPDYRIYMEVHQFDGRLGEYALLNMTWTVVGRDSRDILFVRRAIIQEPVQGANYEAFVAAKSRILAALSREMAKAIKGIKGGN